MPLQEAKSLFKVDTSRIVAVGHSNGGLMAQVLGSSDSNIFTGEYKEHKGTH